MALINPLSCECVKSELDLFAVPLTQTSVESSKWIHYGPISTVNFASPIEFLVSSSESEYVDLSKTYILVKAKIVNANGTNLADDAPVSTTNLWLHSMFNQVDMQLQDTNITPSNSNTYPYRAYLETLLSFGKDAKDSQLTAALYYPDLAGHMDATGNTSGFARRQEFIAESASVDMIGKLHLDMMYQERYLLNGVDIKLRLIPNYDKFCLMVAGNADEPKVVLEKVTLIVRKVGLNSAVQLAHMKALEESTAKYPIRRVDCKTFNINTGSRNETKPNLFNGQCPKRIVIGFVKNSAFNGHYNQNPFNFEHFNLEAINLTVDGQQVMGKPLTLNFGVNDYIEGFATLFTGTAMMNEDSGNCINRTSYRAGYTLFAFDLTPDMEETGLVQLIKQSVVSLDLKFRTALAQTVNCIVYAEFENLIEIDERRNVICDYA